MRRVKAFNGHFCSRWQRWRQWP